MSRPSRCRAGARTSAATSSRSASCSTRWRRASCLSACRRPWRASRDRLWLDTVPPRSREASIPPWLQEIILRCLEPRADDRYQSAAHVAFDLRNPEQVGLTARAAKSGRATMLGAGAALVARPPRAIAARAVARRAGRRGAGHPGGRGHHASGRCRASPSCSARRCRCSRCPPEFRLICVSVVSAGPVSAGEGGAAGASGIHLEHLVRLRHWVEPLRLPPQRLSMHVIESPRPESALLDFARRNNVDLIVLGAPSPTQHALAWWRSVASSVTANARCSVYVVRLPEPETVPEPGAAESTSDSGSDRD